MPVWEKFGSRDRTLDADGTNSSAELVYVIDGTTSDLTAADSAELLTPYTFRGLVRKDIELSQVAPDRWEATLTYKDPDKKDEDESGDGDPLETGEGVFSFDTTGATGEIEVVQKGRETKEIPAGGSPGDYPDMRGVIKVEPDRIGSAEIVMPALRLTYRTRLPKELATIQWIKDVASITGTTNDSAFYSFEAGELLFLGVQGEQSSRSDPECLFSFSASKNQKNLVYETIDGDVTLDKDGHEFLWFWFGMDEDTTAKVVRPQPKAVYVNQVYDSSDFSILGIGTE